MKLTRDDVESYLEVMCEQEKSKNTISKYRTELFRLLEHLERDFDSELDREGLLNYKESLRATRAPGSVNSALSAINNLTGHLGRPDLKLKLLKSQKQFFRQDSKSLTQDDYNRLVRTARRLDKTRTALVLETLGATGIRISELGYITCEAVSAGQVSIDLKGKTRVILLPSRLRRKLSEYISATGVKTGAVFRTRTGGELSRQQVWREMKQLCRVCGIPDSKVYPHNFRHMFACVFYENTHDLVALSNMLGHSSIETTRIYLAQSDTESVKKLDALNLC